MTLQLHQLNETIQISPYNHILILNSAADPYVPIVAQQITTGAITLAEDNIASLHETERKLLPTNDLRYVAFHEYPLKEPPATIDIALMNLLYQPSKAWMIYGLQVAAYALKPGARLYVIGAKDRGILSIAKHMEEIFGNFETLLISKGHRVVSSRNLPQISEHSDESRADGVLLYALYGPSVFAHGNLDEGTRLLIETLEVQPTDNALDIGCGAGYIGLHIARLASKGHVTMVDVSLATVALAQHNITASGLTNIQVLPSDGAQAVLSQRFDLVVTNPPFHHGGIQTTAIAERFIRQAALVLHPNGRFYLVANRFLKYEPTLKTHFKTVNEIAGDTRFKVLRALKQ